MTTVLARRPKAEVHSAVDTSHFVRIIDPRTKAILVDLAVADRQIAFAVWKSVAYSDTQRGRRVELHVPDEGGVTRRHLSHLNVVFEEEQEDLSWETRGDEQRDWLRDAD